VSWGFGAGEGTHPPSQHLKGPLWCGARAEASRKSGQCVVRDTMEQEEKGEEGDSDPLGKVREPHPSPAPGALIDRTS
jgi:hypothetical protein